MTSENSKSAASGHICWLSGTIFILAKLNLEGNIIGKFQENPPSGLVGDAITNNDLWKVCRQQAYWLVDQNGFRSGTTRPWAEHHMQVSWKPTQCSWRRCDNKKDGRMLDNHPQPHELSWTESRRAKISEIIKCNVNSNHVPWLRPSPTRLGG